MDFGSAFKGVLAVDVGGTDIKAGCFVAGEMGSTISIPSRAGEGGEAVIEVILSVVDAIRARCSPGSIDSIGLVVPGVVDSNHGRVLSASNFAWKDVPLPQIIADRTGLPVGFGHDVRSAALAEREWGAARGVSDFAFMPIGTGIAVAVVLNGRLYEGRGMAGEVGHGGAVAGLSCACGGKGCLETVASAAAIARRYRDATGAAATAVPGALEVSELAQAGDNVAAGIWNDAVNAIADLIASFSIMLDLPLVVIGGGLSKAGAQFFQPLQAAVAQRLSYHHVPEVVAAELGHQAGMWGAALVGATNARFIPALRKECYDSKAL